MRLVVAEKPSVARDLGRVLGATRKGQGCLTGSGLTISWCVGHLAQLQDPAHYRADWKPWRLELLPMVPEHFELKVREGVADQVRVLKRLMNDSAVEEVVNACDAGREGELIFRWLAELSGCRKPVRRLWISSLTDSAIKQGWANLRPSQDFDGLADAARCRSEADWLVGLNATRALTCRAREGGGALMSLGRVQTPTLALIVDRDAEIDAFVPEDFWQVKAQFDAGDDRTWVGLYTPPKPRGAPKDFEPTRFAKKADAEELVAALQGKSGELASATRKAVVEPPPLLYDLTELQRRANQRFGFPADRTLAIAQELYERHKLLTYPRTDARYITPDQVADLADIVAGIAPIAPYAATCAEVLASPIKPGKRVVNAAEVGDHHAILPTGRTPSSHLEPDAKRIFDLVARRFLAVLSPNAEFEATKLVVHVEGVGAQKGPAPFLASGRVCREAGWHRIDPPKKRKEVELPFVSVGEAAAIEGVELAQGKTKPPRRHNDASILYAMEHAGKNLDDKELKRVMRSSGLGTPATRAAILKRLVDRKYVFRKGKELRATEHGKAVIESVPVPALRSAELTGRWEGRLSAMVDGRESRDAFMNDVVSYTAEIVEILKSAEAPRIALKAPERAGGKALGSCPVCEKPVRERGPVYACDTGRSCSFVVFKKMSGRTISARAVGQLLRDGRSKAVKGFKSKAGNEFSAGLLFDAEKGRVGFWFPPRDAETSKARTIQAGASCPKCSKGTVIQGRKALGCSRWREGCDYVKR